MAHFAHEYRRLIAEGRRAFLAPDGDAQRFLRQLYDEYAQMLIRLVGDGSSGAITAARAEQLSRSLIGRMRSLDSRLAGAFDAARDSTFETVIAAHEAAIAAAGTNLGIRVATSFADVPDLAVKLMMVRRGLGLATTFRTLSNRRVTQAAADVDRLLISAVARGQSERSLRHELAVILGGNDPRLLETLRHLGPGGGRTREAIKSGIILSDVEMKAAKRLLSDSRRIAQSEINTAYTESDTVASMRSQVIAYMIWLLSAIHSSLSSAPDVCDVLAEQDWYGLGAGGFPPEAFPGPPHAYDQWGRKHMLKDPRDWGKPRPPYKRPDYQQVENKRSSKRIMNSRQRPGGRTATDKHVARQRALAREVVDRSYQVSRDFDLRSSVSISRTAVGRSGSTVFSNPSKLPQAPAFNLRADRLQSETTLKSLFTQNVPTGMLRSINDGPLGDIGRAVSDGAARYGMSFETLEISNTGKYFAAEQFALTGGRRLKVDMGLVIDEHFLRNASKIAEQMKDEFEQRKRTLMNSMRRRQAVLAGGDPESKRILRRLNAAQHADRQLTMEADPDNALYMAILHEGGHGVYFSYALEGQFLANLRRFGVGPNDIAKVSLYAGSDPKELWAEAFAMIHAGHESMIPSRVVRAILATLSKIPKS